MFSFFLTFWRTQRTYIFGLDFFFWLRLRNNALPQVFGLRKFRRGLFFLLSEVVFGVLEKFFVVAGKDDDEGELKFHFGELNHFFYPVLPNIFEVLPLPVQIDGALLDKFLIFAGKIIFFDVETPLVIHNFVGMYTKRLYLVGHIEQSNLLFPDMLVGRFKSGYDLQICIGYLLLF